MQNLKIITNTATNFFRDLNLGRGINKLTVERPANFRPVRINLFSIYLYAIELLYTFYK
ncbi:hypothetical protein [Mucilaginibacter flavus]|uniref:hypothetical protein n=1 Tax=Mucilaginibacter flavus TaxID=931504 RepID=UPI0025B33334|nr:hypothetical protein [Mucilaginibacter flavus]MDN3584542.1 hypothetical protein [Mucilaginibacter flavus]